MPLFDYEDEIKHPAPPLEASAARNRSQKFNWLRIAWIGIWVALLAVAAIIVFGEELTL